MEKNTAIWASIFYPKWPLREEFTSLAQLFGSLHDERESTQEAGERRLQEMDIEEDQDGELLFLDAPLKWTGLIIIGYLSSGWVTG